MPRGSVVVWHNGRRVPDALWRRLIPRTGDQVVIRARVRGGGGGGKLFRTVALIALTIAANVYGAQLGAALGLTGNFATAVGTARSEEHTSELQSLMRISYAVFCLKKTQRDT